MTASERLQPGPGRIGLLDLDRPVHAAVAGAADARAGEVVAAALGRRRRDGDDVVRPGGCPGRRCRARESRRSRARRRSAEGDPVGHARREPDRRAVGPAGRELVTGERDEQRDRRAARKGVRVEDGLEGDSERVRVDPSSRVIVSVTVISTSRFVRPAEKNQKWPLTAQPSSVLTTSSTLSGSKNQK